MFPIDREWAERREAILREQEEAVIRAARADATTDEERAFMDALIEVRARNARPAGERQDAEKPT